LTCFVVHTQRSNPTTAAAPTAGNSERGLTDSRREAKRVTARAHEEVSQVREQLEAGRAELRQQQVLIKLHEAKCEQFNQEILTLRRTKKQYQQRLAEYDRLSNESKRLAALIKQQQQESADQEAQSTQYGALVRDFKSALESKWTEYKSAKADTDAAFRVLKDVRAEIDRQQQALQHLRGQANQHRATISHAKILQENASAIQAALLRIIRDRKAQTKPP